MIEKGERAIRKTEKLTKKLSQADDSIRRLQEDSAQQVVVMQNLKQTEADTMYELEKSQAAVSVQEQRAQALQKRLDGKRTALKIKNAALKLKNAELQAELGKAKCALDNEKTRARVVAARHAPGAFGGYDAMARQFGLGRGRQGEPSVVAPSTIYPLEGRPSPACSDTSVIVVDE